MAGLVTPRAIHALGKWATERKRCRSAIENRLIRPEHEERRHEILSDARPFRHLSGDDLGEIERGPVVRAIRSDDTAVDLVVAPQRRIPARILKCRTAESPAILLELLAGRDQARHDRIRDHLHLSRLCLGGHHHAHVRRAGRRRDLRGLLRRLPQASTSPRRRLGRRLLRSTREFRCRGGPRKSPVGPGHHPLRKDDKTGGHDEILDRQDIGLGTL